MDCVRSAIRQGANQVRCVYRADSSEMPATPREVLHAQEEGVQFHFHLQPIGVNTNSEGQLIGVHFTSTLSNSTILEEITHSADVVIIAFGFESDDMPWISAHSIQRDTSGRIIAPRHHHYAYQTSHPKIFAGGDVVHGSDLVVTAIAEGRGAAEGIMSFLQV